MKSAIIMGPGTSVSGAKFYEHLKEHGVKVEAIWPDSEKYKSKEVHLESTSLYILKQFNRIPFLNKVIQYFYPLNFHFLGLGKAVASADLIHSVETFNMYTYQALKTGKPVVLTVWENIPFLNEQRYYKNIKKLAFQKAAHYIAISTKAKRVLMLEGVPKEIISVIPHGIDTSLFTPQPKSKTLLQKYGLEDTDFAILFVGSLIPRKGAMDLLHAVYKLLQEEKNVTLLVAGRGPEQKRILDHARSLEILDHVKILDFVPYSKTPELYNIADVFCMPSRPDYDWEEQFGMVFLEAMACEKPIVSTRTGSIPEVVDDGETGILVNPGDVLALADSLSLLYENKGLCNDLGKKGRRRVQEYFESSKQCKKIAEVYKKVVS